MSRKEEKLENRSQQSPIAVSRTGIRQQKLAHVEGAQPTQVHERGEETVTSNRDPTGDSEPALIFSLRGLDMYERGSKVGESGMTVLDEPPEMSVMERRAA